MNIYVESNFVLELTLQQEEQESCEAILALCERGQATLVLPAYCLAEPNETLIRRANNRKQLAQTIKDELYQLSRSMLYKAETDTYQTIVSLLTRSGSEEQQRLVEVCTKLLKIAEIIPLDKQVLASAPAHLAQHGFSPQDAIVFASVLWHLGRVPPHSTKACFLNKNSKDFDDVDIRDTLAQYDCEMKFKFSHGLSYLQSQI